MTKIDIISGFLGAGKTTLIKKLLKMNSGRSVLTAGSSKNPASRSGR